MVKEFWSLFDWSPATGYHFCFHTQQGNFPSKKTFLEEYVELLDLYQINYKTDYLFEAIANGLE